MLNEIKKNNNITLIVIKKTLKWETSRLLFSPLFHCSSLEEKYNGNEWVWGYKLIMDFLLVPYGMVSKILLGDGSYHGNWSVKRSNESSFVLYASQYSLGLVRGKENSYTNHQ